MLVLFPAVDKVFGAGVEVMGEVAVMGPGPASEDWKDESDSLPDWTTDGGTGLEERYIGRR